MLEELAEAIEGLIIPPGGDALVEAIGLADRLSAAVSAAVGDFAAGEQWALDGATSPAAWLRHSAGLSWGSARRLSLSARRLRTLPVTRSAWEEGSLSGEQVQAVLANVTEATAALFADHEADVVTCLVPLSVGDTVIAMRRWAACAEDALDSPPPPERPSTVHLSRTLGDRGELRGSLDPGHTAVVEAALRLATTDDVEGEPARTPGQRRADALADLCRHFLDHQGERTGGRHRPHVNVVIDLEELERRGQGRLIDGPVVDARFIEQLLCDAGVHRVVTAGRSVVLDYGTTTRTISAPLWAALVIRDLHCRFSGCDRPATWCEGHHVRHWAHGGETDLSNLVLLCSRHHHLCHSPGWSVKLLPDAVLEVTTPEGRVLTSDPPLRR